jgi:hypothetical protein
MAHRMIILKFNVKTWDKELRIGMNLLGTEASRVYFKKATELRGL